MRPDYIIDIMKLSDKIKRNIKFEESTKFKVYTTGSVAREEEKEHPYIGPDGAEVESGNGNASRHFLERNEGCVWLGEIRGFRGTRKSTRILEINEAQGVKSVL